MRTIPGLANSLSQPADHGVAHPALIRVAAPADAEARVYIGLQRMKHVCSKQRHSPHPGSSFRGLAGRYQVFSVRPEHFCSFCIHAKEFRKLRNSFRVVTEFLIVKLKRHLVSCRTHQVQGSDCARDGHELVMKLTRCFGPAKEAYVSMLLK